MLRVTYEYICDSCKKEEREAQKWELVANSPLPVPLQTHRLDHLTLCNSCYLELQKKLSEIWVDK